MFAFVFTFFLDVHVRAKNVVVPKECKSLGKACAVLITEPISKFLINDVEIRSLQGSSFLKEDEVTAKLIRGSFLVHARDQIELKTLHGILYIHSGTILVKVNDALTEFFNIEGELNYTPRGEQKKYSLPVGLSNYFSHVTSSGVALTGFPKLSQPKELIKNLSQFYNKQDRIVFKKKVKDYMNNWNEMSHRVRPWLEDTVKREIASHEAEQARLARLKAKLDAENNEMRKLLKRRIFDP